MRYSLISPLPVSEGAGGEGCTSEWVEPLYIKLLSYITKCNIFVTNSQIERNKSLYKNISNW